MDPAFAAAAFAMTRKGEISAPVLSKFGYHIILFEDRRPARVRTFEEVKPELMAEQKARRWRMRAPRPRAGSFPIRRSRWTSNSSTASTRRLRAIGHLEAACAGQALTGRGPKSAQRDQRMRRRMFETDDPAIGESGGQRPRPCVGTELGVHEVTVALRRIAVIAGRQAGAAAGKPADDDRHRDIRRHLNRAARAGTRRGPRPDRARARACRNARPGRTCRPPAAGAACPRPDI